MQASEFPVEESKNGLRASAEMDGQNVAGTKFV
jgi:hypothetical protein